MTSPRGSGELASALCLEVNVPFYYAKNQKCLFFSESAFNFPEFRFYFPESPFYFLEVPFYFPELHFYFLQVFFRFPEVSYCFPELLYSFPEVLLSIRCVSFSRNTFFPVDCTFYSSFSGAGQRDDICLALNLFPLGIFCWPTYDAFFITSKPLHGVWYFMYFFKF